MMGMDTIQKAVQTVDGSMTNITFSDVFLHLTALLYDYGSICIHYLEINGQFLDKKEVTTIG